MIEKPKIKISFKLKTIKPNNYYVGDNMLLLKNIASNTIYSNDVELYSYLMNYCFLIIPTEEQQTKIHNHIKTMNEIAKNGPYIEGFISKLYAPNDTNNVKEGERCFYTHENALIIDTLRNYIDENVEDDIIPYCLVPLLNKPASIPTQQAFLKDFIKKTI